ncbi:hypothetical protein Esti_004585 [Eimeria stiedai]
MDLQAGHCLEISLLLRTEQWLADFFHLFHETSFFSKRADLFVVRRRLALSGEHPDREGQIICEGAEEETCDETNPTPQQTSLSSPKEKKARVEAGAEPSGPSSPVDADESTSESDGDQQPTSEGRRRKRLASKLPSGPAPGKDEHQSASEEVPESPGRNEEELEVASALLALQESFAAVVEPRGPASEPTLASAGTSLPLVPTYVLIPILATSTGAAEATASSPLQLFVHPVGVLVPSAPALVSTEASPTSISVERAGAFAASASSHTSSNDERPSTSSAVVGATACPGPREHPYYRIPTVDPLYRGVRRFNPERAKSFAFANLKTCVQLSRMRSLLAEELLTPPELDELAGLTSEILSYTYHYEHSSTKHLVPSIATQTLGRRYLLLDAVIAALQVLEEPPNELWWQQIVSVIPDDSLQESSYARVRYSPSTTFHRDLMKKLHRALQILKTGTRLSKEDTILLKRSLFCNRFSPRSFKDSKWDPWREDDKDAGERS